MDSRKILLGSLKELRHYIEETKVTAKAKKLKHRMSRVQREKRRFLAESGNAEHKLYFDAFKYNVSCQAAISDVILVTLVSSCFRGYLEATNEPSGSNRAESQKDSRER